MVDVTGRNAGSRAHWSFCLGESESVACLGSPAAGGQLLGATNLRWKRGGSEQRLHRKKATASGQFAGAE